jgi:hypothetical protein
MAAIVHPCPVTPMRPYRRFERAAGSHRLLPVVGMSERVELDEVDVVDAQPLERAVDVLARLARRPRARLGGEKEVGAVARHPGADPQLRVAVARGGVEMIDAVPQQDLQGSIGLALAGARERGAAEQRHRARVAGAPEHPPLDHDITQPPLTWTTCPVR